MNKNSKPTKVSIFDKEYLISCEDHEREQLRNAVEYLNNQMNEMKKAGNVIGSERIAVMAALNITNELLAYREKNKSYTTRVDSTLKRLQRKINNVLEKESQPNMEDPISQRG